MNVPFMSGRRSLTSILRVTLQTAVFCVSRLCFAQEPVDPDTAGQSLDATSEHA